MYINSVRLFTSLPLLSPLPYVMLFLKLFLLYILMVIHWFMFILVIV